MKTWQKPLAAAQTFAANDYVSACYYIKCLSPNGNAAYSIFASDSNGNGIYEPDIDATFWDPKTVGMNSTQGCGGTHLARIEGTIANNGFAVTFDQETGAVTKADAMFLWEGDVADPTSPGTKFTRGQHGTDLSVADAYRIDDETNFS